MTRPPSICSVGDLRERFSMLLALHGLKVHTSKWPSTAFEAIARSLPSNDEEVSKRGHAVAEAAKGAKMNPEKRVVIITDVSLPGMPEDEVLAQAIGLQPELRIIFARA